MTIIMAPLARVSVALCHRRVRDLSSNRVTKRWISLR